MNQQKAGFARINRQQNLIFGCSLVICLAGICVAVVAGLLIRHERQTAQYPGSARVSSHSNYTALPREIRWDDSYLTADPFPQVYNWYSGRFGLGTEARANGTCILLEGLVQQQFVERYTGVMLCDTPTGRMIFVSRSATAGK